MTSSASPKNVEKDVSENESDGALEEVNSHIKAVFEILNSETTKARKEMKSFDTMAKKLKHVHFSKTLKLNVGGQLFSTSLDTMKKDPGKSAIQSSLSGSLKWHDGEDPKKRRDYYSSSLTLSNKSELFWSRILTTVISKLRKTRKISSALVYVLCCLGIFTS